eukprot:SAG31_NODE_14284_length_816_cov_1.564854_1_plen_60_part_01
MESGFMTTLGVAAMGGICALLVDKALNDRRPRGTGRCSRDNDGTSGSDHYHYHYRPADQT